MRVWQPGGHLMRDRGAQVEDWSWRRTRRRLGMLVRFTRPNRTRTLFSIGSLLLATSPVYRDIYEHGLLEAQFVERLEATA
jgi:hypothetical protein